MNEELSILKDIAAGNAVSFAQWVSSSETAVRRSLTPFAAHVDTEAVLQEAYLRVWQVAERFVHDGKPNALLRFTITTARNVAISQLRKRPPPSTEVEEIDRALNEVEHPTLTASDPFLRAHIFECREKLPTQPKAAMTQRMTGFGDEDRVLAERCRMSLNTFLQNISRARKLLIECLKKAGIDIAQELAP